MGFAKSRCRLPVDPIGWVAGKIFAELTRLKATAALCSVVFASRNSDTLATRSNMNIPGDAWIARQRALIAKL
ncbi:hypothetical protein PNP59_04200 [Halobacterium salinarum]|uniref:hypothetical protein n=1 Tax=Halobacterium TaxID=2239 RepID=UPI002555C66F|nr:hypothetical protein [Halobacterium salinarum]MDL0130139.1 hypothetical protein [Halobacterium salinarum]